MNNKLLEGVRVQEPSPVYFRGIPHRGLKNFTTGTHRAKPPEETFEVIRPYLHEAGVTRVADITGLDNVGVPTTLAIRPNATTMACSSGKGLSLTAALVSGAMEAIELYAAETVSLPFLRASYDELTSQYVLPALNTLPFSRHGIFSTDWPLHWHLGWDLLSQSEVALPLVIAGMARDHSLMSSLGAFLLSSNGLGAGNSFLEALGSALYEVIERDGVACHHAAMLRGLRTPVFTDSTLRSYSLVAGVLDLCDAAGIRVLVFDCTVDTDIPIFMAYVYNRADEGAGTFRGYGAHLDTEVALLRAITEALQGRLNFIAGARDDIFRAAFWRARSSSRPAIAAFERQRASCPEAVRRPSRGSDCFETDVNHLLDSVRSVGLEHVIVVDITPSGCPAHVVRVLVPGLEGYMHHEYRPGRRATSYAMQEVS